MDRNTHFFQIQFHSRTSETSNLNEEGSNGLTWQKQLMLLIRDYNLCKSYVTVKYRILSVVHVKFNEVVQVCLRSTAVVKLGLQNSW